MVTKRMLICCLLFTGTGFAHSQACSCRTTFQWVKKQNDVGFPPGLNAVVKLLHSKMIVKIQVYEWNAASPNSKGRGTRPDHPGCQEHVRSFIGHRRTHEPGSGVGAGRHTSAELL